MPGPQLPPPPKLGAPAGGPPGGSATGPGAGGPVSSPMATPQPMPGIEKAARVQVQMASEMLQRELPHFPLDSPEFKAVSGALSTIQKAFGKSKDEDRKLFPAELMNMLGALGPGGASAGQKALSGAPSGGPPGGGGMPPVPAMA